MKIITDSHLKQRTGSMDMNSNQNENDLIRFKKLDPNAIIPTNAHSDDVGLDVSIIRVVKTMVCPSGMYVAYFGTGLAVQPPDGYYFDMIPRSSFHKTGWLVANSVGVIDPNYRGELIVACATTGRFTPHPEFPMRAVQLVLRKIHKFDTIEVVEADLTETERGTGGFGSTGR